MIDDKKYPYRIDGRLHDYAVYYIHEDGTKTWGYVESLCAFDPGETVELSDGLFCVIDFEL